jgi:ribosome-associated heat shock protein Hsp15
MSEASEGVRLDQWLWAARFFKTRSLAAEAIDGGKVSCNGDKAKRSKSVRVGDEVRVRQQAFEWVVRVTGLGTKRGSATVAATLYEETAASRAAREALALQMRVSAPAFRYGDGKPSKKDRRDLDRLRRGG